MANTVILPAALRYQTELATNVAALKAIDAELDTGTLGEVTAAIKALRSAIVALRGSLAAAGKGTVEDEARHAGLELLPAMAAVRSAADDLEAYVADDLWPLPTYQEMLLIL